MMSYLIIIPARLKSTRLKEKLLIKINKIPIIIRTYLQCLKVTSRKKIIIATDSEKIMKSFKKEDTKCILIKSKCLTGTDRIAEVAKKYKAKFYINVQGDEPFLNPRDLKKMTMDPKNKKEKIIPRIMFNDDNLILFLFSCTIEEKESNFIEITGRTQGIKFRISPPTNAII